MSSQSYYSEYDVVLSRNSFVRPGYVFVGWGTSPNSNYVCYADGATVREWGDVNLYAIWKLNGGTVRVTGSRYVNAGQTVRLTLVRSGGSGRIAVKYKSQTSTAICGEDFDYVKDIVTWSDGDYSSRTIEIPTYLTKHTYRANLMLRIKLSSLSTGTYYSGYSKAVFEEDKVYLTMRDDSNAGTICVSSSQSISCCHAPITHYSAPWRVAAGDELLLTLSRVGGTDGRIAVKYKTQTSTGYCGMDFDYVKGVLVWEDGEAEDKTIDVQTYCGACIDRPSWAWVPSGDLLLRVKLSTLTTGDYLGCLVPELSPAKIYVTIEEEELQPNSASRNDFE